ncbi:hypothetical protein R20233_04818 [Ralstonia sp. LMG 32965]|uniref:hypothetical protein n=1 Tax=Ralstonia flatus TaxID=3058601 RepID=UPI0028F4EF26|nr:hypothetical protein [Ralstonia sp. LMG 32965]CAJ0902698.1 hypothetical protein R20233_04818 [Ralstonia sp. LMG 32965]
MQSTRIEARQAPVKVADYPQWVIVENAGADSEDIWSDHYTFQVAVNELKNCGGTENGFDLMKRLPGGSLTTEF